MKEKVIDIEGRTCHIIINTKSPFAVIIKPLGEFERLLLKDECTLIAEHTCATFTMIAFEVDEKDLLPEGVEKTYKYLEEKLLSYIKENLNYTYLILGGYSLGGLFALWSSTRLRGISAVFAGSPSLWMDGWDEYTESHPTKANYVYMSLGNKEECTKKQPFCKVGDRVRHQHELHLKQLGASNCILEWNEGGHFNDIEMRKAKGFAWCLEILSR